MRRPFVKYSFNIGLPVLGGVVKSQPGVVGGVKVVVIFAGKKEQGGGAFPEGNDLHGKEEKKGENIINNCSL